MARLVQLSGRTNWYYRFLQPGLVGPGDRLQRPDRACPDWTLERIWRIFYVDTLNRDELVRLAELEKLAASWRDHAVRRLRTGTVEDWNTRLRSAPAGG